MNIETLAVSLTGDATELTRAMDTGAKAVERFSQRSAAAGKAAQNGTDNLTQSLRQFKERANQLGEGLNRFGGIGAAITAAAGAAVALASQYDRGVSNALQGVKNSFVDVATEVGRTLAPAMESIAGKVNSVVGWFRSLSPETRTAVSDFAALAAGILMLVGVAGKLSQLVGAVAAIGAAFAPILPTILSVTAGVLGVVAAIGAVSNALDKLRDRTDAPAGGARGSFLDRTDKFLGDNVPGLNWLTDKLGMSGVSSTKALEITGGAISTAARPLIAAGKEVGNDLAAGLKRGVSDLMSGVENIPVFKKLTELVDRLNNPDKVDHSNRMTWSEEARYKQDFITNFYESSREWMAQQKQITEANTKSHDEIIAAAHRMDRENADAREQLRRAIYTDSETFHEFGALLQDVNDLTKEEADARRALVGTLVAQRQTGKSNTATAAGIALGSTVGSLVQGLTGGGLVGLLGALVQKSRAITNLIGVIESIFENIVAVTDPLITAMTQYIGVIRGVTSMFLPVFRVFYTLGTVFQYFWQYVSATFMPMLFNITKALAVVSLNVMGAIMTAWNSVVTAIQSVVRSLATTDVLGTKPFLLLADWADGLEMLKDKTDYAAAAQSAANAKLSDFTIATTAATTAITGVTESLTNVPEGFKVAAARFAAMAAVTGPGVETAAASVATTAGPGVTNETHVYVDGREVAAAVAQRWEEIKRQRIYAKTGQYSEG